MLDPSGRPVDEFAEDMTKLMHFIVVSKDLADFQHLHPVYEGEGRFGVKLTFPHGGPFLLVSEFMPDGKGITVYKTWIEVGGDQTEAAKLKPDASPSVFVDGIEIKLSAMPVLSELKAGEMIMLNFTLKESGYGRTDRVGALSGYGGPLRHSGRERAAVSACPCRRRDEHRFQRHVPYGVSEGGRV